MTALTTLGLLLDALADRVADRVLERLAAGQRPEGDPWLVLPKNGQVCGVRTRRVIEAGARGELLLGRVGRTPAVRRSVLDAWIASRPVEHRRTRTAAIDEDAEVIELAAKRLAKAGGSRR